MEEGLSDPSRRKTEKVTRPRWNRRKNTAQRLEIDVRRKGEGTARLERVRRHKRFEIFKGTVRGEERKGRVRVPLFCLVRGCSRETRITHELALSQFYTRHVPSKRVVKSTRVLPSSPLVSSDTLCPLALVPTSSSIQS